MKRGILLTIVLIIMLYLCSCTVNEPAPSPSASVAPETTPEVVPSESPLPTESAAPTEEPPASEAKNGYRPVTQGARTFFETTDLNATPYYGANNLLVLPVYPIAQSMGYTVSKANDGGTETLIITRAGHDDVILEYAKPTDGENEALNVLCKMGASNVPVAAKLLYNDDMVYAPMSFFNEVLGKVDVTVNGGTVTVKEK